MLELTIPTPELFSLEKTVLSHGWGNLAPFLWSDNKLYCASNVGGEAYGICICQQGKSVVIQVEADTLTDDHANEILNQVAYSLNTSFPIHDLLTHLSHAKLFTLTDIVSKGWGRLLRGLTPWEDAVKTLLTTNCSWDNTKRMVRAVCSIGPKVESGERSAFPLPDDIITSHADISSMKLGYRLDYLLNLAKSVNSDAKYFSSYMKESGGDIASAERAIFRLRGLGDYAAKHLLVLLGWHEYLPIDREVIKHLGISTTQSGKIPRNISSYCEHGAFRFTVYKLERIANRANWIGN